MEPRSLICVPRYVIVIQKAALSRINRSGSRDIFRLTMPVFVLPLVMSGGNSPPAGAFRHFRNGDIPGEGRYDETVSIYGRHGYLRYPGAGRSALQFRRRVRRAARRRAGRGIAGRVHEEGGRYRPEDHGADRRRAVPAGGPGRRRRDRVLTRPGRRGSPSSGFSPSGSWGRLSLS